MDKEAVLKSEDSDLQDLGLHEKGHIICLRAFCTRPEESENAKQLLASCLRAGKQRILKTTRDEKSVNFCWKHFDTKKSHYVSVRTTKGGGTRQLTMSNESDYHEVVNTMTQLFFPDGRSIFGLLNDMDVEIGDFKGDLIKPPFCLKNYISVNKLSKTRLYLMTKKISSNRAVTKMTNSSLSISDDDDDINFPSLTPTVRNHIPINNNTWLNSTSSPTVVDKILNDETSVQMNVGSFNESK